MDTQTTLVSRQLRNGKQLVISVIGDQIVTTIDGVRSEAHCGGRFSAAQVEVNAARVVVAAAANWEAAHSQSLVEFVDSRIESTTLDGLGTLLPVISEIRRCGWISEDQTRPTTPDERLLTSVANLVIEARRMVARADGPYYFVDGKWVGLKTLCICERIKVARQTRGLTLQDVGDVLGIDGRHVHAWEAGRRNPGPKHLAKLAEVLGLQLADLLPHRT